MKNPFKILIKILKERKLLKKKTQEEISDLEFKQYRDEMRQVASKFAKDNGLVIGQKYKGYYFCNNEIHEGKLTYIDAASDGIFAGLKLEDGTEVGDIDAYSLAEIGEEVKPRRHKTLSEKYN